MFKSAIQITLHLKLIPGEYVHSKAIVNYLVKAHNIQFNGSLAVDVGLPG